jgi:hypothetical protein
MGGSCGQFAWFEAAGLGSSAASGQVPSCHTHASLQVLGAASRVSAEVAAMQLVPHQPQSVLEMQRSQLVKLGHSDDVTTGATGLRTRAQLVAPAAKLRTSKTTT